MQRDALFAPGEWYHCFSRGVDKRDIFLDSRDYDRFLMLLFAANGTTAVHISALAPFQGPTLNKVLEQERGEPLVELGAYALMPNHYHLLVRERTDNGISTFMRKLGTGYTMYFNKRRERTGALFSGKFKSRHVHSNEYFRRVMNYIHANPAELFEADWKHGVVKDERRLKHSLASYPYSSYPDYCTETSRAHEAIISKGAVLELLEEPPTFAALLEEASIFARELE